MKALFRRAKALSRSSDFGAARRDLREAARLGTFQEPSGSLLGAFSSRRDLREAARLGTFQEPSGSLLGAFSSRRDLREAARLAPTNREVLLTNS